jgi:hypothetical protein
VSARLARELRRKRQRREDRLRYERERVCGGPLVDIQLPVVTMPGVGDAEHAFIVQAEASRRMQLADREARLLAYAFARRCLVRLAERDRMHRGLVAALDGRPGQLQATHSTSKHTPTSGGMIPSLGSRDLTWPR